MASNDDWPRSVLNAKYRSLREEFLYKGNLWANWTSEAIIRRVEDQFQFRSNDVIISSYPKSGNTFLSEIVSLLSASQGQQEKWAKTLEWVNAYPIYKRVVFIEEIYQHLYPKCSKTQSAMEYLERWPVSDPHECRLIKTHLPADSIQSAFKRVSQPPQIIYVYRNPKDTCVSMFHFYRGAEEYGPFAGDWNEFFQMWLDGWIAAGDWRRVVPEWLRYAKMSRNWEKAILCISYESLVQEPLQCVERLNQLLNPGCPLDPDVGEAIRKHTSFEQMRKNPQTNYQNVEGFVDDFQFMRKGKVGDWKNWFTEDQNYEFDRVYEECINTVNKLLSPNELIFE
ncbi:unnamed protein product [Echinostoma caproni]|uniref:Sulfotransferase 1B1 n=1 Tax=Echinostoma caproni TaxID=27848 RepID=A0A183ABY1_9TREM|nr:unnamed protein product [Echinostoma caproni]